ncbi:hypothetical protein MIDIC_110118 [Alphaproteobacteria bacterium]
MHSRSSGSFKYIWRILLRTAAFSKEELNKLIFTIRMLCGAIILLVLGMMYIVRKSEI